MRRKNVVRVITISANILLTSVAFGATAAPVMLHNAPIDTFHHWSDEDMAAMIKEKGTTYLSDHEFFFVQELNRVRSGEAETHDYWNDYFVIQNGSGTLTYGGKELGGKSTGVGEWRGGKIEGGNTVSLQQGDLIVIPAGTPHLVTLKPGNNLRYLVFKARQ